MRFKTLKLVGPFHLSAIPAIEKKIEQAVLDSYDEVKLNLEEYRDLNDAQVAGLLDLRERVSDRFNQNLEFVIGAGSALGEKLRKGAQVAHEYSHTGLDEKTDFEIQPIKQGITHIDLDGAESLAKLAHQAIDQGAKKIFLNLKGVHFIGAAGLMTLLRVQNEIKNRIHGDFFLLIPRDGQVYEMLLTNSLIEKFKIGFIG